MRFVVLISLLGVLSACGPVVGSARVGAGAPPRPADCSLELVEELLAGADYEQVGTVTVARAPEEARSTDASMLLLIKPEACALGGERVTVMNSGTAMDSMAVTSSYHRYLVWKKKGPSAEPKKF